MYSSVDRQSTFVGLQLRFAYYRPKRSFGQGNIFTPVCHSVHRGGGVGIPACLAGQSRRGVGLQFFGGGVSKTPEYGQRSAGTHPTGMHSCVFL